MRLDRCARLNNDAWSVACNAWAARWLLWWYQQPSTRSTEVNRGQHYEPIEHNADHECAKLCVLNARSVCSKADCLVNCVVVDHYLWTFYVWHRRDYQARTPCLQPLSHPVAISLSMLLGVTAVYFSKHHIVSITPNSGPLHRLNASIYNYALIGSPLVRLSSKDQCFIHPPYINQSSLFKSQWP